MTDYRHEWARFADWCRSTDHVPLPATEETVLAYLAEESPTGGTAARWVAAIRDRHRVTGHPDPSRGTVRAVLRRGRRGAGTDAALLLDEAGAAASRVGIYGWPTGVFGCRDRLAYLLSRVAGLSVPALLALRTEDVTVAGPGRIEVAVGDERLQLAPTGHRVAPCIACAALRWGWILHHADAYAIHDLASKIRSAQPSQPRHICDNEALARRWAPAGWPLFPPIDRWGAFPAQPAPAMSVRSMEGVLRAIARGEALRAPARVPGKQAAAYAAPPPAVAEGPSPTKEELARTHEEGIASRNRARVQLADIDSEFDGLDDEMSELEARIQQLLEQAMGD